MHHIKIKPDFAKIKAFLPNVTDHDISILQASDGVDCYLEYMRKDDYNRFAEGLKTIVSRYNIEDHYFELLYIILQKNEQIRVRYDAYWQNYSDDLTSSEVAKFLLAYKESNADNYFQLVAKENIGTVARPKTESAAIKDSAIAKWMCGLIYKAIEAREFPLGLFGEKILFDLFGDDFLNEDIPITMERLKATANLSPRKPSVREKKLFVELCKYVQVYLITRTELTAPDNVSLTDAQANFFFDILELIGYINGDKIDSEPKDYIHAMFRNILK